MPILAIVSPEEWLSRTSVKLGRRSASTQKIDNAYRKYHAGRDDENARSLHIALDAYLLEKGGHWEQVDRNKNSGGLMKYIHGATAWAVKSMPMTRSAQDRNTLNDRMPNARHGVLYLWENTQVETQFGKIFLESALSLGSTAVATASDLQHFQSDDARSKFYSAGQAAGKIGSIGVGVIRGNATASNVSPLSPQHLPLPMSAPNRQALLTPRVPVLFNSGPLRPRLSLPEQQALRNLHPGTISLSSPEHKQQAMRTLHNMGSPTHIQGHKNALGRTYEMICSAIRDGITWIWGKILENQSTVFTLSGKILEKIILTVVGEVCAACVPLVGAGINLGRSVFATVKGIKDRLEVYFTGSKFVMAPGHPSLIACSIEKQMNWAIGKGLFNVIKEGAKLGMTVMTVGASVILDAIAAGLEFATKTLLRLKEGSAIEKFLTDVRDACRVKDSGNLVPAIVHDAVAFNDLFARGCEASPCISMMTLNSGITGDQMVYMKMFDDTLNANMTSQDSFDAATDYFTQLKQHGREYVRGSGFTFSSPKKEVQGYLSHAVNHHQSGNLSLADAALNIVS